MRRLPRGHAGIAALAALWLGCTTAEAQPVTTAPAESPPQAASPESQPAGFDELRPPPPPRRAFNLQVTDLYAGMELDSQYRRVRSKTAFWDSSQQKNQDTRVEEYIGLGLIGDIGDPGLFDFRGDLKFGLTQSRFKEDYEWYHHRDHDNGFLAEYDVNADILKSKPISFNVYARRFDQRIPRRFLPSLRETNTETGISGLAVTGPVTTEFGFNWRDVQRDGNRFEEDDEELETTRAYANTTWQISEHQKLRLSYEHEDQGSDYQGSLYNFDLKRDELRAEHEIAFGPGNKHRFDFFARYNQERGDLERDEVNFVPRLTLQHTDKLRTVWRYNYYRVDQDVIEIDQHKFDAEALYQATKNLRFGLNGFTLFEHADNDVDTTQWGLGGDVGYLKSSSLGETNLNLHLAYDSLETHGSAGDRLVRNEGHALSDVRPVILRQRNIRLLSILAHSQNYTRVYVPGVDYVAVPAAGRVVVTRVPWGRIARDEVVYFDYLYEVPARYGIDTWWTSFLAEHRFKCGLVPYYSFEGRFQNVDNEALLLSYPRNNQNRHRLGTRFERPWWNVGAEYEIFDDSIQPYDAVHFTGRASLLRRAEHSLDVSAELSRYWFEGSQQGAFQDWLDGGVLSFFNDNYLRVSDRRRVWWAEFDIKDNMQIRPDLSMSTGTVFHFEDDSRDGRTRGIDLEWGLKFVRGYLSVDLTLEYDLLAIAENREQGFTVFLNVRRNLSHLLPQRRMP